MKVTLAALLAAGFIFERTPGQGGRYWLLENLEWRSAAKLDEAWEYYGRPDEWGIELWKPGMDGGLRYIIVTVVQPSLHGSQSALGRISLSTVLLSPEGDPTLFPEFLAWTAFLVGLTRPWYGWGGNSTGLSDTTPIDPKAVAANKPQIVEWLNIYGPSYVSEIGLHKLLTAPAWRADTLADGSIMLVLVPDQYTASSEQAQAVASHLGFPVSD